MNATTTTIDLAIDRSVSHTQTVTVRDADLDDVRALIAAADEYVATKSTIEAWGTTESGDEWRVHITGAVDVARAPRSQYEGSDDMLASAAAATADDLGLESWQVDAAWGRDHEDIVVRARPDYAAEVAAQ